MITLSDKPKMDDRTRKALEESIAKWERNAVAETPGDALIGAEYCPLCVEFNGYLKGMIFASCDGCPVSASTGWDVCEETPYGDAEDAYVDWSYKTTERQREEFHAAAREEVAFLKSLLPQDDEK